MRLDEKERTLMIACYTGLTNEGLETFDSIYFPVAIEDILSMFVETLANELNIYGKDDSNTFYFRIQW